MRAVFASDVHLESDRDPFFSEFLRALEAQRALGMTHLILVGDVLDVFLGAQPAFSLTYETFLKTLKRWMDSGLEVHWFEGNHDFQLDALTDQFASAKFFSYSKPAAMRFDARSFFIAHGDEVDRSDYGYLLLRWVLRTPVVRFLSRVFPGSLVQRVGRVMNGPVQKNQVSESDPRHVLIRDRFRRFARQRWDEGFDYVILGHCHIFDDFREQPPASSVPKQLVNCGYVKSDRKIFVWTPDQSWIEPVETSGL